MKKMFLIACCIAPAMAWAQQDNFVLHVKIANIEPAAKAHLHYVVGEQNFSDSAVAKNGLFEFKGILSEPAVATLEIDHQGMGLMHKKGGADVLEFYLDKGNTNVIANDSVKLATIPGSKLNEEAAAYNALKVPILQKISKVYADLRAAAPERQKDKAFVDSLGRVFDAAQDEWDGVRIQFIKDHPDSYVSLQCLKELEDPQGDIVKLEPVLKMLSPRLQNTATSKELAEFIVKAKATAIGVMAPAFSQADANGNQVSLQSFRGKYVLLDFWASWCGPCRHENPNVVAAYKRFKDKNFTIVGISLDQPGKKDAWLAAVKADGLDWTQLSDLQFWKNAVAKQYGIRSIPQNFLIDPTGKIIAKNLRGHALDNKLAEVLQ